MGDVFRSAFTQADLIQSATQALVTGSFQKIGEYNVQAGEVVTLGYGSQSGQENAQGRIYVDLRDNAVAPGGQIKGKIRFSVFSPQNRPLAILGEYRTETLYTSSSDRTKQVPFPEQMIAASEDKKIVVEFLPDAAVTLSKANSVILMDITQATA